MIAETQHEEVAMRKNEFVFVLFGCIAAASILVMLVNTYIGNKGYEEYATGYIAGYAEAKAGMPSRHQYPLKQEGGQP